MLNRKAKWLCLGILSACALSSLPSVAQAEISYLSSFGGAGVAAGKLTTPAGIAINDTSGDVYVVDRASNRIEQFSAAGAFIRAWGYDVVASGADDKSLANEVAEVRIRATSGSFALVFKGEETAQLPFDAGAGEVQSALNGLATIGEGGGSVAVSGGPGNASGADPYVVTFDGSPLAGADLELGIEPSGLGVPTGTQLSCEGGPSVKKEIFDPAPAESFAYRWLANGIPVPGATAATFIPGPGEAGKAIQCEATASFGAVKTMATSHPYVLASPASSPLPPLGPASLAAPTGTAILESAGGVPLACDAGSWSRGPETFTYQWYRNGVAIGTPTTTAASSDEYLPSQSDLATKAVFQCAVTGHNAGGSSTTISRFLPTSPEQKQPVVQDASAVVTTTFAATSKVLTRTNGGAVFEVCKATVDTCKAGVAGAGIGQLSKPRSIAVDSSPSGGGAVYVRDDASPRVQKFSAGGAPILMIGGGVDQTTDGDVCTVASGDICGPGVLDKKGSPTAFGGMPNGGAFAELGNELAADPAGNLYVGDPRIEGDPVRHRIQKFDPSGSFLSQAKVPSFGGKPISIAADSTQRVYASLTGDQAAVERFSAAEFNADGSGALRPGNILDDDGLPEQLAIDPRNDRLLASGQSNSETVSACGGPAVGGRAILEFDPNQNQIDCSIPTGQGALPQVTGMAVSKAGLLYAAVGSANVIKVFQLPTSAAPQISSQSAREITTETARVHGEINPGFEDTAYRVEYGPEKCANHPCQAVDGGTLHGLKFTDGATQISGLAPSTTYHYRVVAENKLGTVKGPDRTFTTFALVDLLNDPCPNALARKQTKTAGLLDCRAYELASAASTGGYDVESDLVPGQSPFEAYPDAQGKLLYGVHEGGIPGTGSPTNRGLDPYVATRGKDGRWATGYLGIPADNPFATAPFSSTLAGADSSLATLAFSGHGICSPCFADGSAGIPVHLPGGELVQGMAGSFSHPSAQPDGQIAKPLSANGEHLIFGSTSRFAEGGNEETGDVSIYDRNLRTGETHVVSNSPEGEDFPDPLSCLQGVGACHSPANPNGIAELDISSDGSRILLGQKVATDAKGNARWHLYLNLNDSVRSIDLAPATVSGASFNGMTKDATKFFFTTTDKLLGTDEDESADIYAAEVDQGGAFSLRLVSVKSSGAPSNSDACTPAGEPASWNAAAGDGKCGALAFAGGAGVASGDGSLYFLSPEKLDGTKGTLNQPNLYLTAPGQPPRFIATIDTSVGKPPASGPIHPLLDADFADTAYEAVQALTLDQSNGDLYALDAGDGTVYRYKANGEPRDFTAGPHEANRLSGFTFASPSAAQVAIDNSPSALAGDIYLASEAGVSVFAPSGEALGTLNGSGTKNGAFGAACGVAVDQSSGTLYVADAGGFIWRYAPNSPTLPLTDADYTVTGLAPQGMQPCAVAADSAGHVYASQASDGPVRRFVSVSFVTGTPPNTAGVEISSSSKALATDPATNEVFVDEGNRVAVFDATGKALGRIGEGKLGCGALGSRGVAVNKTTHHLYASCFAPSVVKEFGYEVPAFTPVDNPAILHATAQAETHSYGDFQVTPEGRYAAFPTTQPLTAGYDNAGHQELYRYDALGAEGAGALDCVSCSPTGSQAASDSSLPPNGLGLLADGRVFFDSGEQLTLRDTNEKPDAYEWEAGAQQLISTGNSAFGSGMLGASADGTDAFFFTRDVLVPEDKNGQAMKIYDARQNGGFFVVPPPPPCAASDECHGPGTKAAAVPQVPGIKGSGGQFQGAAPKCRKPKVRRRGKCVKAPQRKHKHHKAKAHKPAKSKRGTKR